MISTIYDLLLFSVISPAYKRKFEDHGSSGLKKPPNFKQIWGLIPRLQNVNFTHITDILIDLIANVGHSEGLSDYILRPACLCFIGKGPRCAACYNVIEVY